MQTHLHQVLVSTRVGGASLIAIRLAEAAQRIGMVTRAWVPGTGATTEALDSAHVKWRTYDLEAMRGPMVPHLVSCLRMAPGLIGVARPLVHVHNPIVYRFIRPALVVARARVIVHFHLEPTIDEIERTLAYPPDRVVVCARFIEQRISEVLGRRASGVTVTVVHNAVDVSRYKPGPQVAARACVGLPTNAFVMLMMANLARHKGQATALRAAQILKARGVPIECWLVGEDRTEERAYERELRLLSTDLGLDHEVRFLGFRSDGPDLLRAADVFLLPSTHEGLPLSLLEAQASRLPVVASPLPGILEALEDGKTGFVVPADDHVGYADRVQLLLTEPRLREAMVETAALQVTRDYGWATLEAQMLSAYRSLS
jgi:glycosyltransferase involved in cell wall biosynthesis